MKKSTSEAPTTDLKSRRHVRRCSLYLQATSSYLSFSKKSGRRASLPMRRDQRTKIYGARVTACCQTLVCTDANTLPTGSSTPNTQKQAITPASFHGRVFPPQLRARIRQVVRPMKRNPPIQSSDFHRCKAVRLSFGSLSACEGLALTMKKMTTTDTSPMGRLIQKQALHVTLLSVCKASVRPFSRPSFTMDGTYKGSS